MDWGVGGGGGGGEPMPVIALTADAPGSERIRRPHPSSLKYHC